MLRPGTWLMTGVFLLGSFDLRSDDPLVKTEPVKFGAVASAKKVVSVAIRLDRDAIQPGKSFFVYADVDVPSGTHIYGPTENENKIGIPTTFEVKGPPGFQIDPPIFPPTQAKQTNFGAVNGYFKSVKILVKVTPPSDLPPLSSVPIEAKCTYQYCDENKCYSPKTKGESLSLKVVSGDQAVKVDESASPEDAAAAVGRSESIPEDLPMRLGLAFLAGLFLNFMPCVLPVIAIKVLGFVQHAGENRSRVFLLNAVYAMGVVAVFLGLGFFAVSIGLNWGQQFQSREFSLAMILVVFAMGLSLAGLFEIPVPGFVGSAGGHSNVGLLGAFLSGAVTTLLATPCTGPFLGPLLAWSLKQMPIVSYAVWGTMGLGMASPYLIFGLVPGAVRLLPRPGDWMVVFKQLCGFAMFATAIFLLNSVKASASIEASQQMELVIRVLYWMLGIAFAAWAVGTRINILSTFKERWIWRSTAVLGLAAFIFLPSVLFPKKLHEWRAFSETRLQELMTAGQPVLIDFTADWCLNCRTNEFFAIETPEVAALVRERGIQPLYADNTNFSPEITKWTRQFGSDGIPLTVVIGPGGVEDRIVLDGLFQKQTLIDAIEKIVPARR